MVFGAVVVDRIPLEKNIKQKKEEDLSADSEEFQHLRLGRKAGVWDEGKRIYVKEVEENQDF